MPNQDNSLKRQDAFCEACSQALGLKLADETKTKLLNGEELSLDELSKHHTLTEIGSALIRLDALSLRQTEESCECYITFLGKKYCFECFQIPPD